MIENMIIEMKLIHERALNNSIITLSFCFYLYACIHTMTIYTRVNIKIK